MKTNPKLELVHKLHDLIHSKEGLWKEIAKLNRTWEYTVTEDFYERIKLELAIVERHLGETKEVKELKDLIAFLAQSSPQQAATHPAA